MTVGTVLLVEDEPALRDLIQRMLVSARYEVIDARNGAEAVRHYPPAGVDLGRGRWSGTPGISFVES